MTTIYYLSSIIFILYELARVLSPIDKADENIKFQILSKKFKGMKWDEYSDEYKSELKTKIIFVGFIFIWFIVGLFTFQWVAFLLMLLFQIFIISPLSKATKNNFRYGYIMLHWINSVIGVCFAIFIIINHYHLKIDLLKLILNYYPI